VEVAEGVNESDEVGVLEPHSVKEEKGEYDDVAEEEVDGRFDL